MVYFALVGLALLSLAAVYTLFTGGASEKENPVSVRLAASLILATALCSAWILWKEVLLL